MVHFKDVSFHHTCASAILSSYIIIHLWLSWLICQNSLMQPAKHSTFHSENAIKEKVKCSKNDLQSHYPEVTMVSKPKKIFFSRFLFCLWANSYSGVILPEPCCGICFVYWQYIVNSVQYDHHKLANSVCQKFRLFPIFHHYKKCW